MIALPIPDSDRASLTVGDESPGSDVRPCVEARLGKDAELGHLVWELPLLFSRPPLTQNQRSHWTYRARITREIHAQITDQVTRQRVPALTYPTVRLHYQPRDKRRRDVDNLVPTSKACLDGLVVAGVLVDDSSADVDHLMPTIHPPAKGAGRIWLEVTA